MSQIFEIHCKVLLHILYYLKSPLISSFAEFDHKKLLDLKEKNILLTNKNKNCAGSNYFSNNCLAY